MLHAPLLAFFFGLLRPLLFFLFSGVGTPLLSRRFVSSSPPLLSLSPFLSVIGFFLRKFFFFTLQPFMFPQCLSLPPPGNFPGFPPPSPFLSCHLPGIFESFSNLVPHFAFYVPPSLGLSPFILFFAFLPISPSHSVPYFFPSEYFSFRFWFSRPS